MKYEEDIIIERYRMERTGEGKLVQTLGGLYIPDTDFYCMTLERPIVKNLPSVSRLPEGVYSYKIINKTPSCNMSHIIILGTQFRIEVFTEYQESNRPIIIGKEYVEGENCLNVLGQREIISEVCKRSPEKGTIRFVNCEAK